LHFDPGGLIGPHETAFAQLLIPRAGLGWADGADGRRQPLRCGQVALVPRGVMHSEGSDSAMTAVMVQVTDGEVAPRPTEV